MIEILYSWQTWEISLFFIIIEWNDIKSTYVHMYEHSEEVCRYFYVMKLGYYLKPQIG